MNTFLELYGIIHQVTLSYSSKSIMTKKKTLIDIVNEILINFDLSNILWDETLYSAYHMTV